MNPHIKLNKIALGGALRNKWLRNKWLETSGWGNQGNHEAALDRDDRGMAPGPKHLSGCYTVQCFQLSILIVVGKNLVLFSNSYPKGKISKNIRNVTDYRRVA